MTLSDDASRDLLVWLVLVFGLLALVTLLGWVAAFQWGRRLTPYLALRFGVPREATVGLGLAAVVLVEVLIERSSGGDPAVYATGPAAVLLVLGAVLALGR